MEVKVGDRVYQIPDVCPVGAPRLSTLKRSLRAHGVEAFLLSHKLGPLAGCVLDELVQAGAEIVAAETVSPALDATGEPETPVLSDQPDIHVSSEVGEADPVIPNSAGAHAAPAKSN